MIRALTAIVTIAAAGYGGYWFVAKRAVENGVDAAFDRMNAQGVEAGYGAFRVAGFPSRIDSTLTGLRIFDPARGMGWEAPELRVYALSYRPNRIIAGFPAEQSFVLPGETLRLGSEDMRASATVGASTSIPLDRATLESGPLTLTGEAGGWTATAAHLLSAIRKGGGEGEDYDLYLDLATVTLPEDLRAAIDAGARLPEALDVIRFDATAVFDRPIARDQGQPLLQAVSIRDARIDWGPVGLAITGDLTAGPDGRAEGTAQLTVRNWPLLVTLAAEAGLIPASQRMLIEGALSSVAAGDSTAILPVTFAGGRMTAGFIPLGPAPVLPLALPPQ